MSAAPRALGLLVVGHGRMGRAVERVARQRGHRIAGIVTHRAGSDDPLDGAELDGVDAAIEFTHGEAAPRNVDRLLRAGVATVCGSTGWDGLVDDARAVARETGTPFLWSPNFSLGLAVMSRLVAAAAAAFARLDGYAAWLHEAHHDGKRDAPSGTARHLARLVVDATPGLDAAGPAPETGRRPAGRMSVSWTRAGETPGTHVVGWSGRFDELRVEHAVRDRAVFAAGAVRAAEWLVGREGPCSLDEMISDSLGSEPPGGDQR